MTGAECRTHPGRCCNTRPRAQLPRDENKSVPFSVGAARQEMTEVENRSVLFS